MVPHFENEKERDEERSLSRGMFVMKFVYFQTVQVHAERRRCYASLLIGDEALTKFTITIINKALVCNIITSLYHQCKLLGHLRSAVGV